MANNPVINYYRSAESRIGYRLLGGVKHFGYYPVGKENIPMLEAQMLMNEQLAVALSLPKGSRVLDAGCGEGNVAMYLAKNRGLKVSGIDLLDFNIAIAGEVARKQGLGNTVDFRVGTYMDLPYEDCSFDAVYTMETLVHAPDYKKALKEFYRVLKPGGKLVLFEYTIKPESELKKSEIEGMKRIKQVNKTASMPAFNEFVFDSMPEKLKAAGFRGAKTLDITDRIMPMLRRFYFKAKKIYKLFRLAHMSNRVTNAMSAVEFYENQGLWRYEVSTAEKE